MEKDFFEQGYVVQKKVIPQELVDAAILAINAKLGEGMAKADMEKAKKSTFFPELSTSQVILVLFYRSRLVTLVENLIGRRCPPVFFGQIALRFPGTLCARRGRSFVPLPFVRDAWHIDGFSADGNIIPAGEIRPFSLLIGVYLSDASTDDAGNLTV